MSFLDRTIKCLTGEHSDLSVIKTISLSDYEAAIYSGNIDEISHVLIKKSPFISKVVDEAKQGEVLKSLGSIGYTYSATKVASKNHEWLIYGRYDPKQVSIQVFLENIDNEQLVHSDEKERVWWSVLTTPTPEKIIIQSHQKNGSFSEKTIVF